MSKDTFEYLRRVLRSGIGITVDAERPVLIENRLLPVARKHGFDDPIALIEAYRVDRSPELWRDIVEAMTINETYFFRDRVPFNLFRQHMLPRLMEARARERLIRIWCGACSTGQEPYSLAMSLQEEAARLAGWKVEIIATDVSETVIKRACEGRYSQFEVQRGLPVSMLLRHFQRVDDRWELAPDVRARVRFLQLNLISDFSEIGRVDIAFCRNVLIYLDLKTKIDILKRLRQCVRDDGYLVLGAAETVLGISDEWALHAEFPSLIVPGGSRFAIQPPAPLQLASNC